MRRLKIGLFIDTFYPMVDGVINVVDNYAKQLSKYADVVVFTVKAHGKCDRTFEYPVFRCKGLTIKNLDYDIPLLDDKFIKAIKDSNLDIVHIHSPFIVGKAGLRYAKRHKIPVVATIHSQYKKDFYRYTKSKVLTQYMLKVIMRVFNACDAVFAPSKRFAEVALSYGLKRRPLVARNCTNMLPCKDFKAAYERIDTKYGTKDKNVFLFVGRINLLKNLEFIIDSLKIVKADGYDFKMLFVGTGQDEDGLQAKIAECGLSDECKLLGRVSDEELVDCYARAKLFLFPSLYDTGSIVQVEAASQKTPTVFIDDSVTAGTVTNNVNGFTSGNSPKAYARKIEEVLDNPQLYEKVSEGAFHDLYLTWEDCVKKVYKKYLEIIDDKKAELLSKKIAKITKTPKSTTMRKNKKISITDYL